MQTKKLNDGVEIPVYGFGTFQIPADGSTYKAVREALDLGIRHIDTAVAYFNEQEVGQAIRESGIPREEIFVTSKFWLQDYGYEPAKKGIETSLRKLGLDYMDLYLIHQPYNDYYGAWRALEELYENGKVKSIGVDNFTQDRMADFLFFNKIKPAVNMIECNVYFQREDECRYLKEQNILMQAWSPLAAGKEDLFNNEILCEMARKHHKSVAQIVLRWLVQRGIVPVVKSANPIRMRENLDIFDFVLSEEEMKQIVSLDTGHTYATARNTGNAVTEFLEKANQKPVNPYKSKEKHPVGELPGVSRGV